MSAAKEGLVLAMVMGQVVGVGGGTAVVPPPPPQAQRMAKGRGNRAIRMEVQKGSGFRMEKIEDRSRPRLLDL
jgi:hypothetical protein